MPSSTPGFIGERLREARQARGLRGVELAERLKISPQAISSYETGKKSPSPDAADAIANALELPLHFFMRTSRPKHNAPVFFRSMSSATKKARTQASWRINWLKEIADHVENSVQFPAINLPDFDIPNDPRLLADQDIEQMAEDSRKFWKMTNGPIGNMVYLLENQGIVVARDNLGDAALDSLSVYPDRPIVIIGTDKGTAARWRYDAAHELGHLILHHTLDPKLLSSAADFKRIEDQAHRFGSAFLLPMSTFAEEFFSASLDTLRAMKPRWRVSIAMMIMRARDGDLISEEHQRRMFINYYRRQWRRSEPLDDVLEAEQPQIMRKAVELTLNEGSQSGMQLAEAVALAPRDIESLCGLPTGYIRERDEPSVSLRSGAREAKIIKFPSAKSSGNDQAGDEDLLSKICVALMVPNHEKV